MESHTTSAGPLLWDLEQFPVVYEHNQPKAVLVDIAAFQRLALILENLLNRAPESEDHLLAESPELRQLAQWARATAQITPDWEQELNEL